MFVFNRDHQSDHSKHDSDQEHSPGRSEETQSPSPSENIQFGNLDYPAFMARVERRQDKSTIRYNTNKDRLLRLKSAVDGNTDALQQHSDALIQQDQRIAALERWVLGQGPHPGHPPPLPLAPPDKFVGAKPVGADGDFHVRPWIDSIEAWLSAQPHLSPNTWLRTALSYMDHSSRTTWSQHLLPDLTLRAGGTAEHPFVASWADFKSSMIARFGGQAARIAASKLKANKCRYSSSMHEYSARFRALVDKANEADDSTINIPQTEQAALFLAGLPKELRVFIAGAQPAQGFPTLAGLAECEHFCTLKQGQYNELFATEHPQQAPSSPSKFKRPHQSPGPRRARSPSNYKDRPQGYHKRSKTDSTAPFWAGASHKPHSDLDSGTQSMKCAFCKKYGHHIAECRTRLRVKDKSPNDPSAKSHVAKGKDHKSSKDFP
jgi:hypothetical protein